jgi:hypothetical protein
MLIWFFLNDKVFALSVDTIPEAKAGVAAVIAIIPVFFIKVLLVSIFLCIKLEESFL